MKPTRAVKSSSDTQTMTWYSALFTEASMISSRIQKKERGSWNVVSCPLRIYMRSLPRVNKQWHEEFLILASVQSPEFVTAQLSSRQLLSGQVGRLLVSNLRFSTRPDDAREKLVDALATRFEYWTDRIVLLHGRIHPADRVQFHEDTFSMVTPLSITLADGVNAFYEDTYKQRHTGVVQTSRPAWTYFLARCQFFLDGECSIHDEILLWIGHPDSETFQTT